MIKRILSAVLCIIMVASVFVSCSTKKDDDDKGAIINMYLSQEVYDFDPAYAYKNDAALKIVDLLFSSLFKIDEKGRLEKELCKSYTINKDTNTLTLVIDENAKWSDGTYVSANDVVYSFKRVLTPEFSSEVACLLFDIKNARTVKNATSDLYIDDIGIYPIGEREVEITFEEGFTDYEGFLYNLASPALAPIREDLESINKGDWAKKPGTMSCSGPFKLSRVSYDPADKGLTLERNPYYFRKSDQAIDKSVTPYRIIVDYTKTAEEQYEMFKKGELFYVGDIALSIRGTVADVEVADALSTATVYLNHNLCVGAKVRDLDSEAKPTTSEVTEKGITYITTTYKTYYTYYNYMTDEEYQAKYGAPYVEIPASKKSTTKDYQLYNTVSERRVDEEDPTIIYIDEYQEWRYKVQTTNEDGTVDVALAVDAPGGKRIFSDVNVRKALSLVIDREAIAKKVVYAKAATALVPSGIFGTDYKRKTDFRADGGDLISTKANAAEAEKLLTEAGIDAKKYEIELAVQSNDVVHCAIAEEIAAAWESLGFKVYVNEVETAVNDEMGSVGEVSKDIRDDLLNEMYETGNYATILVDVVAPTPSAFAFLAPFAKEFAGTAVDMDPYDGNNDHLYEVMGHRSGYNSEAYNAKIEAAFAEKDSKKRAELLHEAEKILLDEVAVIPVVFNQDAYLVSKELKNVDTSYFNTRIFTKTVLKDYHKYLPVEE